MACKPIISNFSIVAFLVCLPFQSTLDIDVLTSNML
nr:MAG TPA: hypothetical protein [Bacteriophage sp.]